MSWTYTRLLGLLIGPAALSVFRSDQGGTPDGGGGRSTEDSSASKEQMLLMGRLGRGEISLEEAKAIYGEDLLGITTISTPPVVEVEPELDSSQEDQAPVE